jgi:oxygen-independent coproporphyrinogen III oxidase
VQPYLSAVAREAARVAERHVVGPLDTVYFGGGTPSLLLPGQVGSLLHHFDEMFGIQPQAEVTLEAHPSSVTEQSLSEFVAAGVTRISLGGESLQDGELEALGRDHDGARVVEALRLARAAGAVSLNVDLMYGIPGQTVDSWSASLAGLISGSPDHISLYPLSVEPLTVFIKQWQRGRLTLPEDDMVAEMYVVACKTLGAAGFQHYEVANWSLPGHHCRHNLAVWQHQEYVGLGVGAHGFTRPYRTENVRSVRQYIDRIDAQTTVVAGIERLSPQDERCEAIVLGLRLLDTGLDVDDFLTQHGVDILATYSSDIDRLVATGLLVSAGGRLRIPEDAVPVANEVWRAFA